MKVYFVGAGPGNPDLLTVAAERLLRNCAICIYAGSLVSPGVMSIVNRDAELHNSAAMSLEEIIGVCHEAQKRNIDVVRLHSGDPALFGSIVEQIAELKKLNITVRIVPGVSSVFAAAAALAQSPPSEAGAANPRLG